MKGNKLLLFLFIIPTLLVIFWFKDGNILGTGESSLPFYNFNIQYNINKDAWAYYALGHPLNIGSAATPSYWFFAKLQNLGIPTFILQAIFIWLIFVLSGLAIYKLAKELFPDIGDAHYLLAVLFYWFNPFSLVNVWNRFLNNFFVFYALLPITVYFFIRGLRSKRYIYAILIGLASAVFSYALTSMAFILLLWVTLAYLGFMHLLIYKNNRLFVLKFFFLTFLCWSLANFWWISQVFSYLELGSFTAVTSTSFKTDSNYNTFSLLSQKLGLLIYIFRLKHAEFFNNTLKFAWLKIYFFPIVTFFEFLIISISLLPLIIKKKSKYIFIFAGLFFISLFLTKGNNPPLGEIVDKVFLSVPSLQLFRNPLEKIGFILSLSSTILFTVGCYELERIAGFKRRIITQAIIGFFLIAIWGFPFWTGYVFTSNEIPTDKLEIGYQVKVPSVYADISDWLLNQKDNFRLVVLPIGGEGITYNWEKGYSGVELSNQLLPKPAVSFNTNIPFYDDISSALERMILTREGITKVMNILNSKYILVRKDIDWRLRNMREPVNIADRIENIASGSGLKEVKKSESLTFWENTNWIDRGIYLTNDLIRSRPTSPMEDVLNVETDGSLALYNSKASADDMTKFEIFHPNFKFVVGEKNIESSIILRDDIVFPAVNVLPSSFLYPLVGIKEKFETARLSDQNVKIIKEISLLGKRLIEADKESLLGHFSGANKALSNYELQLKGLYSYQLGDTGNKADKNIVQEELYTVFLRHRRLIDRLINVFPADKKDSLISTRELLNNFLLDKGIEPIFGFLDQPNYSLVNRAIYQFTVDREGSYELLFNISNWNNYFKKPFNEPILFQVDNNLLSRRGELKQDGQLSFGFFKLSSGKHEIGWDGGEPINLIDAPAEFSMTIDHGILEKTFPIKNLDPYSTYVLNVDYFIKRGNGVLVSIEGNNDSVKEGVIQRQFRKNLGPDAYSYDLKKYTVYYTPSKTSDNANLIFTVFPWNNCRDIYRTNRIDRCENEEFKKPYDRTTEVVISNVSLVKTMTEIPFLRLERDVFETNRLPEISFKKMNNSRYEVDIKNAKEKYALILSELFDPAWALTDQNGVNISGNHFLANGYANGWIIDKKGDYRMIAEFTPQDLLEKSRIISAAALILGLGLLVYIYRKNKNEK